VIARAWHALTALLVLAALVIQVKIAIDAPGLPPGHAVGTLAGTVAEGRLVRVASFFTIQSNILVGVATAQLARRPDRDGALWRVFRVAGLVGITVTGIVYSTVLARIHEPRGWEQTSTNAVFHYVVPLLAVIGWLLYGPRPRIARATVLWSLAWPVLWFGYTLSHGEISGWYPYPFVSVADQGYGRVLLNALVVTALLGAVAAAFALGDARLRPAPDPGEPAGDERGPGKWDGL
jgi:hypothetical protein